jgi:hypothetical protein
MSWSNSWEYDDQDSQDDAEMDNNFYQIVDEFDLLEEADTTVTMLKTYAWDKGLNMLTSNSSVSDLFCLLKELRYSE